MCRVCMCVHIQRKNLRDSVGPAKSKYQDRIKCARILSGEKSM